MVIAPECKGSSHRMAEGWGGGGVGQEKYRHPGVKKTPIPSVPLGLGYLGGRELVLKPRPGVQREAGAHLRQRSGFGVELSPSTLQWEVIRGQVVGGVPHLVGGGGVRREGGSGP